MTGRGLERVSLHSSWVEEGTGGLWYASVDPSVGPSSGSSRPAHAPAGASATTTATAASVPRAAVGAASEDSTAPSHRATTLRRLERAISQGAPAYNRGDVRRCAEIYLRTAREVEPELSSRAELTSLREAVSRAEALLAEADSAGALAGSARRKADAAAWVLRHAFDRLLASNAQHSRGGGARRATGGCTLS